MPAPVMNLTGEDLSREKISLFENDLGIKLPADYVDFLLKYNGGRPTPYVFNFADGENSSGLHSFYGFRSDSLNIHRCRSLYKERIPKRFIPIAHDEGGNLVCISVGEEDYGRIYFWWHDSEAEADDGESPETQQNIELLANTFSEFFAGFHE